MLYYRYLKHYENMLNGWMKYSQALEFSKLSYNMFNRQMNPLDLIQTRLRARLIQQRSSDPLKKDISPNRILLKGEEKKLKCSVCSEFVLGLRVYCNNCEHGGHPSHLTRWFQTQELCAACNNCRCTKYNLF